MRSRTEVAEDECRAERRQAVWQSGRDCTAKESGNGALLLQLSEANMKEQFTLVIITLPSRLFLLSRVLARYDGRQSIAEIIIVSPPFDPTELGQRYTPVRIVSDLPHKPGSLNNRYNSIACSLSVTSVSEECEELMCLRATTDSPS
jgi:hypothetical protein